MKIQFFKKVILVSFLLPLFTQPLSAQSFGDFFKSDNLKETLKDVVEDVASEHIDFSIVGTWTYQGAAVSLESSNALAGIGSQLATNTIDNKINEQLARVGIKPGMMKMQFEDDNTFVVNTSKRDIKGTYTYDKETKELTMRFADRLPITSHVLVQPSNIQFQFSADGLLSLVKKVSGMVNMKSFDSIASLLGQYEGMTVGMKFDKEGGSGSLFSK